MYSKYQITKILDFFFWNINCYCWIKPILVLIHLKYWYHNSPYAELPYLPHHLCQILPYSTKALSNTILIMFFIGFHILSYPIRPQATTSIGYTKPYKKPSQLNLLSSFIQIMITYGSNTLPIKSWVSKSRFYFKFR